MDPKKLYFVIAASSFLAGAGVKTVADFSPGVDEALMSTALAGVNETRTHSFKLPTIPGGLLSTINSYLSTTVCPDVATKYGDGVCDGETMPFRIILSRKPNGKTSIDGMVRNIPVFVSKRPPAEPQPPE